jgi:excisionase family DNA binding protein
MEPHRDTLRRDGPVDRVPAHLLGALPAQVLQLEDSTARTGGVRDSVPSPGTEEQTMTDLPTQWLTVREASAYSRCGVKTLYRAVQRGELRAARVGGRRKLVLRREWLDAYLEATADNAPREIVRLLKAA